MIAQRDPGALSAFGLFWRAIIVGALMLCLPVLLVIAGIKR